MVKMGKTHFRVIKRLNGNVIRKSASSCWTQIRSVQVFVDGWIIKRQRIKQFHHNKNPIITQNCCNSTFSCTYCQVHVELFSIQLNVPLLFYSRIEAVSQNNPTFTVCMDHIYVTYFCWGAAGYGLLLWPATGEPVGGPPASASPGRFPSSPASRRSSAARLALPGEGPHHEKHYKLYSISFAIIYLLWPLGSCWLLHTELGVCSFMLHLSVTLLHIQICSLSSGLFTFIFMGSKTHYVLTITWLIIFIYLWKRIKHTFLHRVYKVKCS